MSDLIKRLLRKRDSGRRDIGGGKTVAADGSAQSWAGKVIMIYANPDGPEAAARIEALEAEVADLIHDLERQMTIANETVNELARLQADTPTPTPEVS